MTRVFVLALFALLAAPTAVPAQEPPEDGIEKGLDMMGEGARRLFQDLMDDIGPTIQGFTQDVPSFQQLRDLMGDIDDYQAPEMLPNGDIIIRRKDDAGPPEPQGDEIEI